MKEAREGETLELDALLTNADTVTSVTFDFVPVGCAAVAPQTVPVSGTGSRLAECRIVAPNLDHGRSDGTLIVRLDAGAGLRVEESVRIFPAQSWRAEFVAPVFTGKRKQYVNGTSPVYGRDGEGRSVMFIVRGRTRGVAPAVLGGSTFVVYYDAVRQPVAGQQLARSDTPAQQTGSVTLNDVDDEGTFTIDLGLTGGDTWKVRIGTTPACSDAELELEVWRRLEVVLHAPADLGFTPNDVTALRDRMNTLGAGAFLEVTTKLEQTLPSAALTNAMAMLPPSFAGRASGNAWICTDQSAAAVHATRTGPVIDVHLWDAVLNWTGQRVTATGKTKNMLCKIDLDPSAAWAPVQGLFQRSETIQKISWKAYAPATHRAHGKEGVCWDASAGGGSWARFVDLKKSSPEEIAIVFPLSEEPRSLLGDGCEIEVTIEYDALRPGAAQYSRHGIHSIVVSPNDTFGGVLLHEIGHALGLAALEDAIAPGVAPIGKVTERATRFAHDGTLGHGYEEKGHSGPHCAWGLTDDQKGQTSYAGLRGGCLMFGGADDNPDHDLPTFCPQCTELLRVRAIDGTWARFKSMDELLGDEEDDEGDGAPFLRVALDDDDDEGDGDGFLNVAADEDDEDGADADDL